ncbi:streptophobe family protein [Streptomyces sp. KMM 9044]|uniref:streptophobe family protein n=1 Tax=Streptomyces sp. KMM 9044 TaxID=2744474 RepID=UPI002151EBF6|nr:streptophobe family protein [Streptomyces sp. KMM 9044]WAX80759.1 streptophobe family protein [Streptomyces sp. KMM 9044]
MSAIAAVSWALIGMAGTAALGLRLLDADSAGSLGPMTAAVVALAAGGSVTPSGHVSAFGLSGAEASTAVEVAPLGVGLAGALLLSYFFLRSLRAAGAVVPPAELVARAGTVVAFFVAMSGGLVWAGRDVVTLDGGALGLDDLPGGGGGGGGLEIPGLGDLGDAEGLLPDRIGDLVEAQAAVGFTVDTVPTLLGGLGWAAGVLAVALLASRRTPLPRGWDAVHRVVRPPASALVVVGLVAVAAGLAASGYAAIGDDHPRRIAGAALLGAPNGVWLGVPIGLFVPWDGRGTGALPGVLPYPVDDLLRTGSDRPVTLARLAELDGRVWLLGVAAAVMMLLAGVLAAVRTPPEVAAGAGAVREGGPAAFAGRCALRLGCATALALMLLVRLTEVSAGASLSVLGFEAFGAGVELHGNLGMALLLGAAWGAGAGASGALLAWVSGAVGRRAAPLARAAASAREGVRTGKGAGSTGVAVGAGRTEAVWGAGAVGRAESGPWSGAGAGPYVPGVPYRPPNPGTNPYLAVPEELREPQDARPAGEGRQRPGPPPAPAPAPAPGDIRPPGRTADEPPRNGGFPGGPDDDVSGAPP